MAPENEKQAAPAAISGEQQADLAALDRMVAEGEAAAAPGEAGAVVPAPQGPTLDQEISAMLKMVSGMVKPALPSVTALYTPEVCEAIGNSVAAVCNKHGWLQGGIGGKYGEEIMCLVIVGPIAWATVEAAKTDIAVRKAKQVEDPDKPKAAPAPADTGALREPGQNTVSFGTMA